MDKQFLNSFFEHLPDAVYVMMASNANIIYCNRMACDTLKFTKQELLNRSILSLQKNPDGLPAWDNITHTVREKGSFTFIGHYLCKDGNELPVEVKTACFSHDNQEYFVAIARDIKQRVLDKEAILNREQQLWYALNETAYGLWDWNLLTNEVYFSPRLKQMLGYTSDETIEDIAIWENNIHPDDKQRVMRVLNDHIEGKRERYDAEYRLKNSNGYYLWVHDSGKISEFNEQHKPTRVVGMAENITDRKNLELKLQENASVDMLTGVMNRREGDYILDKQLDLSKRLNMKLGICLFDLDCFKQVNDQYGHLVGDEVLKTITTIVSANIRNADFLYRWGGEEFILIFSDVSLELLEAMSEKTRRAIQDYPWKKKHNLEGITASFGLAIYPDHGENYQELILNADAAMYQAKSLGRNRVVIAS